MSDNPLSGKISLDTTDFKTAISHINRELRLTESGFRASAASLGNWSKSADGLTQRIGALTDEIKLQQKKVSLLKDEYVRVAKEKGENSRAAQNLLIRINRETEGLNKNQRELKESKEALDKVGDESEKTGKSAKKMGDKFKGAEGKTINLKDSLKGLSKVGKTVIIGLTAVAAAATLALGALAVKTGMMIKDATLAAARVEQVADVAILVGQNMGIAEDAVVSTAEGLRKQGIEADSAYEAVTKLMQADLDLGKAEGLMGVARDAAVIAGENTTETFDGITTAVLTLNTEMLRNKGIVFTSKSAYEDYAAANGLVASELTEVEKQAAFANAVIKAGIPIQGAYEKSLENPVKLLGSLKRVFNDIAVGVGGPFTKGLTNIIRPFYDLAKSVAAMVSEGGSLRPILDMLGAGFAGFGDQLGGAITSLEPLLEMFGEMISMLMGGDAEGASKVLENLINSLLDTITGFGSAGEGGGGVNILNFLRQGIINAIPRLMDLASDVLLNMVTGILDKLPMMLDAGTKILTALINGILPQLPALLTAAIEIINTLVQGLLQLLPELLAAALEIVLALADGLIQALPTLIPAVFEILFKLIDTLMANLPMIIEAAFTLVVTLAKGIAEALPTLIPTVIGIIPEIILMLLENLPMLLMAALELLLALAEGIVAALPVLIEAVPLIVETIVDMLIENLPMLIVAAVELITTLGLGLVENIPLLLEAVVDIITGIIEAFKETDWKSIGDNIVAGIKEGFLGKWDDFKISITNKFNGLVDGIKGLLKIDSPSKLFAGIGENMAAGLGGGFTDEMDAINRQIRSTVGELKSGWGFSAGGLTLAMQGAGGAQTAPVINMTINKASGEIDEYRLARKIADQIRRNA